MPGSVKGRVLLHTKARVVRPDREGVCAWCGFTVFGPHEDVPAVILCPRCQSDEIDWIAPEVPVPPPALHAPIDDENTLRIRALNLQGAVIRGRR
jgi:hypothetical protein